MEELMDLLVKDESPTQISDAIKDMLYVRTAEKVQTATPAIMNTVFDGEETSAEVESPEQEEN